jgi:hypothetical protein
VHDQNQVADGKRSASPVSSRSRTGTAAQEKLDLLARSACQPRDMERPKLPTAQVPVT